MCASSCFSESVDMTSRAPWTRTPSRWYQPSHLFLRTHETKCSTPAYYFLRGLIRLCLLFKKITSKQQQQCKAHKSLPLKPNQRGLGSNAIGGLQSCAALGKTLENQKNKQQKVQTERGKSCSFLVALCKCSQNQPKPAFWCRPLWLSPLYAGP